MRPLVALALLLLAAPALGQSPASDLSPPPVQFRAPASARLQYDRPVAFAACPDERYFHHFVAARLNGVDPFTADAKQRITLKLSRPMRDFVAELEFYDKAGKYLGREKTTDPICTRLVEDAGRAVVQWLMLAPGPAPAPAACPAPPPAAATSASPAAPSWCEDMTEAAPPLVPPPVTLTPPERKIGLSFRFGTAVWVGQVTTDTAALGFTLDAGVRYRWFSAGIEGRGDPPLAATTIAGVGSANHARATGALLLCGHYEWFVGCAKGEAGRFVLMGSLSGSTQGYGAAGLRVGLDFPVVPRLFFLRVAGEVLAVVDPGPIKSRGQTAFQITGTSTGLGLGMLFVLDKP